MYIFHSEAWVILPCLKVLFGTGCESSQMVWFLVNRLCSRILLSIVKRRRATTLDWDIPVPRKKKTWHKRSTGARLKVAKTAGEADELWNFGMEFVKSSAVSQFFVAKNPKNFPGFILMWEGHPTLGFFCGSNVQLESFMNKSHDKSHDRSYVVFGGFEVWIFAESLPRLFFGLLLTRVNSLEEFVVFWEVFFGTCGDFVFTVGGRQTVFYKVKNPVVFRSLPRFWGNHHDFLEKGIELIEKTISHSSWNHGNKKDSPYKKRPRGENWDPVCTLCPGKYIQTSRQEGSGT